MTMTQLERTASTTAIFASSFVCRVSGLPVSQVLQLADRELSRLAEEVLVVEAKLQAARDSVSAALYSAVGTTTDPRTRSKLVELRRALYNARSSSAGAFAAASTVLSADLLLPVHETRAALDARDAMMSQLRATYDDALARSRARLAEALQDIDFQRGLALSSRTLYGNVRRYESAVERRPGSRDEQIERGLLRYFTRMATKATPFGTFCSVIPAEFASDESADRAVVTLDGDPRTKRTVVRLNKRIYAHLWDLLRVQPEIRDALPVEPNPTLRRDDDRLVLLTATGGMEVFQRLPLSETLEVVLELCTGPGRCTLGKLVARLAEDARCETNLGEAQTFVSRLVDIGFLRLGAVVAEQEADWVPPLAAFLKTVDDERARQCLALLDELSALAKRYEVGSPSERATALEALRTCLNDGFVGLGLGRWRPTESLLFEDATADACARVARTPMVNAALEHLAVWVALTLPLAAPRADMAMMRHFFDEYYGAGVCASGVPLLTFYEDYYREHFKMHLTKVRAVERGETFQDYDVANPFGLDSVRQMQRARARLMEAIRALWARTPTAEEVVVGRDTLDTVLANLSGGDSVTGRSVDVFAQLLTDAVGDVRLVIRGSQYSTGYGKYFSRFLHLFPERWKSDVLAENLRLTPDMLAEIGGDAAFNANLHPPLLAWEISYPTGQNASSAHQLRAADIDVRRDPHNSDAVMLWHAGADNRVWPVDLGFLNPRMRPPLYQLLTSFSPVNYCLFPIPATLGTASGDGDSNPPGVIVRPRITYEGAVVLARRAWMVADTAYPARAAQESDADYFLRIARWRREHGIPEHVYARVIPTPLHGPGSPPAGRLKDVVTAAMGADTVESDDNAASREETGEAGAVLAEAPDHGDAPEPTRASAAIVETARQNRVARAATTHSGGGGQTRPVSRDFHKPQFIDFSNPLLVRLFGRLTSGLTKFTMTLEECLPTADQLPVHGGEPYAAELILQLGFPATTERDA